MSNFKNVLIALSSSLLLFGCSDSDKNQNDQSEAVVETNKQIEIQLTTEANKKTEELETSLHQAQQQEVDQLEMQLKQDAQLKAQEMEAQLMQDEIARQKALEESLR